MRELVLIAIALALTIAGVVLADLVPRRPCAYCGTRCSKLLPHRRRYEDRGRP